MMRVELLPGGKLPERSSAESAGLDLFYPGEELIIKPNQRCLLPLAFKMQLCPGMVGLILPRSSRGIQGLVLTNTIGVIDSDYRGEIKIYLTNRCTTPINVYHGERIAQMLIMPVWIGEPVAVNKLDVSARGDGGFGSTGL